MSPHEWILTKFEIKKLRIRNLWREEDEKCQHHDLYYQNTINPYGCLLLHIEPECYLTSTFTQKCVFPNKIKDHCNHLCKYRNAVEIWWGNVLGKWAVFVWNCIWFRICLHKIYVNIWQALVCLKALYFMIKYCGRSNYWSKKHAM